MTGDVPLLRRYVDEGSETAFRELVAQRIDFVYAAALRQVGGDAHLAAEVVQNVFWDLARKAKPLAGRADLTGWFYTSTRFAAAKVLRARARRLNHEHEAHLMHETLSAPPRAEAAWEDLRPVIDAALHELNEKDREVILLRFFEGRALAEVGEAVGLAENSARMRVERALEKLRTRLARRGITSTAAALGATLAAQPTVAAPAGLVATVATVGFAGAALGGAGGLAALASSFGFMTTTKLAAITAVALTVGALGGYLGARQQSAADGAGSGRAGVTETPAGLRVGASDVQTGKNSSTPGIGRGGGGTSTAGAMAATAGTPALESLRVLMELQRRKLVATEVKLVAEGAQLTTQFTELFALTPSERDTMQRGLDAARARMAALERENSTVGRLPNGDVTLAMRPFPEAGGAAYDAMMQTFADTLGSERYNAFLTLGAEQAEKELNRFGTAQKAVTISRQTTPEGEIRYRIRSNESNTPEHHSNYLSDWMSYEKLVHEAGDVIALLPPDFRPQR